MLLVLEHIASNINHKNLNVICIVSQFLNFLSVQAGLALGELQSMGDLYDFNSIATLFLIGVVSVTPTIMTKS